MTEVKKIDALSLAKIQAVFNGLIGILAGLLLAFVSTLPHAHMNSDFDPLRLGPVVLAVGIPIFYAVLGFVFGLIGAWIYNILAKLVGGIRLELG